MILLNDLIMKKRNLSESTIGTIALRKRGHGLFLKEKHTGKSIHWLTEPETQELKKFLNEEDLK